MSFLRLAVNVPAILIMLGLASSAEAQTVTFSCTGAKVTWSVPTSGTYNVTATGAQGASAQVGRVGGRGAQMSGQFTFVAGQVYQIAVGCVGQ